MITVLDVVATTPDVTLKIVGALGVGKRIILDKLSTWPWRVQVFEVSMFPSIFVRDNNSRDWTDELGVIGLDG